MTLPVTSTLKTIADLQVLAVDGVDLVKNLATSPLGGLFKLFGIASDIKALLVDAPAALPELKDLDAAEASQVGAAAFALVVAVAAAVKG